MTRHIVAAGNDVVGVPFRELLLVVLVSVIVSYCATKVIAIIAPYIGGLAAVRARDAHSVPMPRIGGIGIFTAVISAIYVASQLPALNRGFPPFAPDILAIAVGGLFMVLLGLADDIWDLGALTKLAGQTAIAGLMAMMGLRWNLLYWPFGEATIVVLDESQAIFCTVGFILLVVNAINIIDGIDGLATGISAIIAAAVCVFSMGVMFDQGGAVSAYPPAIVTAAVVGGCIGFLPHNFHRARIFMGDSGALFLGVMLAGASISASGRITLSLYGPQDMIVLMSPLILVAATMFVPALDLVWAVIRRARANKPIGQADKEHIHHRLLDIGHSHASAAMVLWGWVALLATVAVSSRFVAWWLIVVLFIACSIGMTVATIWPKVTRVCSDTT